MSNPLSKPKKSLTKRLLTVKETANYLGRSVNSVRELQWGGSLPFVQVGKRIHFDVYDLDRWVEEHKTRHIY